jgi:hypothetical protein
MESYTGTFELVDPKVVIIDHRYQREMRPALVAAIASDPRWELFGVPVLFKRGNGLFYVADGQQRIEGIKRSKNTPRLIPAVWFPVSGVDEEAAVFVQINEFRIALSAMQKHKGKIIAKDPATLAIERAVEKAGLSISSTDEDDKSINAVASLYWIYNRIGEEGLLQTLVVCRDAWEGNSAALGASMLRSVSEVIEDLDSNYERQRLTKALTRTSPHLILRKAEELRFNMGGSKQANVRRAIKALAKV